MSAHNDEGMNERRHFERRRKQLTDDRRVWLDGVKDIAQYLLPEYERFEGNTTTKKGAPSFTKILNNVGTRSAETLRDGLVSIQSNPAQRWYGLGHPDPRLSALAEVAAWTYDVTSLLLEIHARSNAYQAIPSLVLETPSFGTGAMYVGEDARDVIRCFNFAPGEYALAQSDRGIVNTCYRDVEMTVEQVVSKFGLENVSEWVRNQFKQEQFNQTTTVTHAIEPIQKRLPLDALIPRAMTFRSVYFEPKATLQYRGLLRVGGYHEFPVMAPRWTTVSNSVYGIGRGHKALADIKQLQFQVQEKLEAIEKQVNPPQKRPAGMDTGQSSTLPGGITTYDPNLGENSVGSLYSVNLDLGSLREDIAVTEERIERAFYVDLFRLISNLGVKEVTARQIDELREEKIIGLGTPSQRLDNELYDPFIGRTFAIAERRGMLPEAPEVIQGHELRLEYFNMFHQIQRAQGLGAMERFVGSVGNLASVSGREEVWDKVNTDRWVEDYAEALGVPPKQVLPDDVVAETRAERQRLMQLQQSVALAKEGAQAAKSLADSPTEDGNILSAIAQTAGAAAR